MNFSTKSEYGLRALSNLDKKGKISVSLARIAREESLSLPYLERLFAILKKANIVVSEKGNLGGYRLARPAAQISILEVLEALEGSISPMSCVERKKSCACLNCHVHPVWDKLNKQIRVTLKNIKLKEILKS